PARSPTARSSATSGSTSSSPARRRRSRSTATSSSARACRASTFRPRRAAATCTCSTCACPTCCTAASCARAGSTPTPPARNPRGAEGSSSGDVGGARGGRRGDFVGVVAAREGDAVKAARALKVAWRDPPPLPENLFDSMRAAKTTDTVIADWGDAAGAFAQAAHVASSTYRCPYQSHAPFAANCALADVGPNGALVISSTQDIYNSRDMLAQVLGLPVDKVRVQYHEGSGTFGRSCYEDAAQAAAVMSQAVGKPVRVQFTRS